VTVSAPYAPARLTQTEFIGLIAMLFATIALSIDAMLPALPEIAATLSPDSPNRAQLVVTSFVLGMGLGTLFAGPLSDAFGR
jgi:DHA1 family bicyclomycin/chloramphenicol resistance-like MFS transporter